MRQFWIDDYRPGKSSASVSVTEQDGIYRGVMFVNYRETATTNARNFKTLAGVTRWASKVLTQHAA